MSPLAGPAPVAADAHALLAAQHLEDGEIILLAVKPSRWLVLLVSWPVVLLCAAVAVVTYVAGRFRDAAVNERMVAMICTAVACTRITVACLQWLSRLYVLTNHRLMRIQGVVREEALHCPLRKLRAVHLAATPPERLLGVGTLLFQREDPGDTPHWAHLADPKEAERLIREAWSQAR